MKLKNIAITCGLAVTALVGSVGCKKSAFDINKNPNNPTDSTITYNFILPAAQATTATIVATDWSWLQNWLGYWARSGTYAANTQEETYNVTTGFQTQVWNDLYANSFNYDIMQRKAETANATFYAGVARIMKAHNFALLVDFYGNVPYKEAFKGNQNPTPRYDSAAAIYRDLFRQIDTGINLISKTVAAKNVDYTTNDLMFAGDSVKWHKFGNTLKLRMLVHLMNGGVASVSGPRPESIAPGVDVAGEFAILNNDARGFLNEGETARINPGFSTTKPNPFYRSYVKNESDVATGNSVYYKANSYILGYFEYNGDPREGRFYSAAPNTGSYTGVQYGLPPVTANEAGNLAGVGGPGVLSSGATTPAWIVTSFESLFLQAEAKLRGYLTAGAGTAQAIYRRAVTESFVYTGLTAAAATSYLANNGTSEDVYWTPGDVPRQLYAIISQKYFALNSFAPFEVYNDWRRTDIVYGQLVGYDPGPPISVAPQLAGQSNVKVPVRLFYPQTEYSYNTANVSGQGSLVATTSRVFWDLQ